MTITLGPELEKRVRERAEAEGLSVTMYIERLVHADQSAVAEMEELALEGLNSGEPVEAGPHYWEEMHRSLDDRLKNGIR